MDYQEEIHKKDAHGNEYKNDSFLYYADNLKVIAALPVEVRGRTNMAIIEYGAGHEISNPFIQIDGKEVDLRIFLRHIFDSIDSQKRRYTNKAKVNAMKEELMRELEGNVKGTDKEGIEHAIKNLKKLAIDVNKHDIRDIDKRIFETMPKGWLGIYDKRNKELLALITSYIRSYKDECLLDKQEYGQLKELILRAEDRRKERKQTFS